MVVASRGEQYLDICFVLCGHIVLGMNLNRLWTMFKSQLNFLLLSQYNNWEISLNMKPWLHTLSLEMPCIHILQ